MNEQFIPCNLEEIKWNPTLNMKMHSVNASKLVVLRELYLLGGGILLVLHLSITLPHNSYKCTTNALCLNTKSTSQCTCCKREVVGVVTFLLLFRKENLIGGIECWIQPSFFHDVINWWVMKPWFVSKIVSYICLHCTTGAIMS